VACREKQSERWEHCAAYCPKEACGGETTGKARFMHQNDSELDRGLCGARDRSGNKVSSRHRDSDDATAGTYGKC
jgi:hypothetical protein